MFRLTIVTDTDCVQVLTDSVEKIRATVKSTFHLIRFFIHEKTGEGWKLVANTEKII